MVKVKCQTCGKEFKVEYIANWKYSHTCDRCILAEQPRSQQDPREARADAKEDFKELARQLAHQKTMAMQKKKKNKKKKRK